MPQTAVEPGQVAHLTPQERAEVGKRARSAVPRSTHGDWEPSARRDPLAILALQATTRLPDLVPIRYGRMAASPFAFYRGAAAVMAADLAGAPRTSLEAQICGDAHLVNFGGFASPERDFVFDVNDFDETLPGPFEWDLKRLTTSLEVAARSRGMKSAERTAIVLAASRGYREAMRSFAGMLNLDIWYARMDAADILSRWGKEAGAQAMKNFGRAVTKAESKDRIKASAKLTQLVNGQLRFISDPPLLVPADELFPADVSEQLEEIVRSSLDAYRRTLQGDRRRLLEEYRFVHLARKVVGVGSVGTRCWLALMVGRDNNDPLFLQVKEAEASVLEPFMHKSKYKQHGQRVVEGQRLMQAASDILLGWDRNPVGVDGQPHDYYVRQLWDWKASADIETMLPGTFPVYGQMCAWALARAHARSGDAIAISAYLGGGDQFDRALSTFAADYADQNERDHDALTKAIAEGTVVATTGV
jgi:uncharacterized protein (DUF2252 family)